MRDGSAGNERDRPPLIVASVPRGRICAWVGGPLVTSKLPLREAVPVCSPVCDWPPECH